MSESVISDFGRERIAILGASRGLGRELAIEVADKMHSPSLLLASRKGDRLHQLALELASRAEVEKPKVVDFTKLEGQEKIFLELQVFRPSRIFYVAGGGPFGAYGARQWKDHLWAFELNLIFPAKLLHWIFGSGVITQGLKQVIFVGSAIAESQPDPGAASYAAAKHGLRGLVDTVKKEQPMFDLRLFSPGYMDTDLLPSGAWPRQQGLVTSPRSEAAKFLQWALYSVN